jgi:L-serine dehydratase
MEPISVFDIFKIGVGPSSSHTLGPWRAAQRFLDELSAKCKAEDIGRVQVDLYGSLALTGAGHGTDIAILLGLSGQDPETIPLDQVQAIPDAVRQEGEVMLYGKHRIPFSLDTDTDMVFHYAECLAEHANGMILSAWNREGQFIHRATYYSIGGGFVLREGEEIQTDPVRLPYPIDNSAQLRTYCLSENSNIWEIVLANERKWRTGSAIRSGLLRIWEVMRDCVYKGCHTQGQLPGGLGVSRRAAGIRQTLLGTPTYSNPQEFIQLLASKTFKFPQLLKLIGCFAMAVNEENAGFSRVVTAPTNGSAGVIPAVLFYYICLSEEKVSEDDIVKFLLTAGEIGSIFKKGSTISAAMGGCQAEIGVSSAMAAAALTECLGGTVGQALMAAEIAMEHHLGLTCDPVGGLVQVPCIERNSMGAIKAITAANIALESDPSKAKVPLDNVIKTMWETAQDMHSKYKETSQGGLAANIPIVVPEC